MAKRPKLRLDQAQFDEHMAAQKPYSIRTSLAYFDLTKMPDDSITYEFAAVKELNDYHFPEGCLEGEIPFTFVCLVTDRKWNPVRNVGQWRLLSPLAEAHSCLSSMGKNTESVASMTDWKKKLDNVRVEFQFHLHSDIAKAAYHFCEDRYQTSKATVYTVKQRIDLVLKVWSELPATHDKSNKGNKGTRGLASKVALVKHMNSFKVARGGDAFSKDFVDAAVDCKPLYDDERSRRGLDPG